MTNFGNVDPVKMRSGYDYADGAYGKPARRRSAWSVLFFVSLAVVVITLGILGYLAYTYWAAQNEYDQLAEHVEVQDSSDFATLASFNVDWDALRAINPDVVGWVYLPGTPINYPIVWRENGDTYYMKHNFNGYSSNGFGAEYGCPVLSNANSPDWTDEMSFVAGHNMLDDRMFTFIEKMADSEVFNEHRTFYLLTPEGNFRLVSFACDKIRGSSTLTVIPNFGTKEEFRQYLTECVNESLVTPDPALPAVGSINQAVAFYTCSEPDNQYRIVVYCSVQEFLPAGSNVLQGNSLVDEDTIDAVDSAAGERLE